MAKFVCSLLLFIIVVSAASASASASASESWSSSSEIVDCSATCPCFTQQDIADACTAAAACQSTESSPIQQAITCDGTTFTAFPFSNECIGSGADANSTNLNDDELSECLSLISSAWTTYSCTSNAASACPLDRNFTASVLLQDDALLEFDNGGSRPDSVSSTLSISLTDDDVAGLALSDIAVSVAIEHTRIGDVLATLSHGSITDHALFGNDVSSTSHCNYDHIYVTVTDTADLAAADLISCADNGGADVNGGEALGFGGENGVVGLGGQRQPISALSAFIDQDVSNINGDWTLTLYDDTSSNIGYFGAWQINLVYINDQVHDLCDWHLTQRAACCAASDENAAMCDAVEAYCQSTACLLARDNADNLGVVVQSMFQAIDIRCSQD